MATEDLNFSREDLFDIDLEERELRPTEKRKKRRDKEITPEQKEEAKEMMKDMAKFPVNVAAETGNFILDVAQIPSFAYNTFQDMVLDDPEDQIPILKVPTLDYTSKQGEMLDKIDYGVSFGTGIIGMAKGLKLLAAKSPKVYAKLLEA